MSCTDEAGGREAGGAAGSDADDGAGGEIFGSSSIIDLELEILHGLCL
jgi:hypothetical protein